METGESPYEALAEAGSGGQWAFGTGFTGPLDGVDLTLPDGVDAGLVAAYALSLGDDALIMAQRLAGEVTRAPELEEEVALANIALDLLGQARLLLARAGAAEGHGRGEDDLAFLRDATEFRNVRLPEPPFRDFGDVVARLLVFSTWRLELMGGLAGSRDPVLAAVAGKAVKELAYHRDHSARWTVMLGDGTAESRRRMTRALDAAWPHVPELFSAGPVELAAARAGLGTGPAEARPGFDAVLAEVAGAAGLPLPQSPPPDGPGGRDGMHTRHFAALLEEMQGVARAHPGASW